MSNIVIDKLIYSSINSNHGIKLSRDKPLNNSLSLNITRPSVLRQYFEENIMSTPGNEQTYTSLHVWFSEWNIFNRNGSIKCCY